MNNLTKSINAFELSDIELDTVAGGFANNTNTSDVFKGKNLPFLQPSFVNFNSFQSNSNVTTQVAPVRTPRTLHSVSCSVLK